MTDTFAGKLDRLGAAVVHSAGVDEGAYVLLHVHHGAEDFAAIVAKHCYEFGARYVNHITFDQRVLYQQLLHHPGAEQFYFSSAETAAWREVMENDGCVIMIRTDVDPDLFGEVSNDYGRWYRQMWKARAEFKERAINQGKCAWTLTYTPTSTAAKRVYPELTPKEALAAYWQAVFEMTLADRPDCLKLLRSTDDKLHRRCEQLDNLRIQSLHFSGPGTSFNVGLSKLATWLGGSKQVSGKSGRRYTSNLPTYEVFTTPDYRTVTGSARITRDAIIEGTLVSGAEITFKYGRVSDIKARRGEEALKALVARDEGAARLGEVALVGLDTPVAQQDRVFQSVLFDENSACHVAVGSAYLAALRDGPNLNSKARSKLGVNESGIHVDLMISDASTTVSATTENGNDVVLIDRGHWTSEYC